MRGAEVKQGWISCGSYMFPYQGLKLDDEHTIVMPNREPRRYASLVDIYTMDGQNIQTEIEVNKPFLFPDGKYISSAITSKWANGAM